MARAHRREALLAAVLTGALTALALWRVQPGGSGYPVPETPEVCLRQFREAILQGDPERIRNLLSEEMHPHQDRLVREQQPRLTQTLSWVIVQTRQSGQSALVLVHEMHRDGWIYPVEYELLYREPAWQISRISYLPPEKASIAPGTHVREAPWGQELSAPPEPSRTEGPDPEDTP